MIQGGVMKRYLPTLVFVAVLMGMLLLPAVNGAVPAPPTGMSASQRFVWQSPLPSGNEMKVLDFIDANQGWFVGDNGIVMKTADGGATWTGAGPLFQQGAQQETTNVYDVCFTDANNGWIGGDGAIFRTTNGGTTWSNFGPMIYDLSAKLMHYVSVDFADANYGWAVGNYDIYRTTNGGTTWSGAAALPAGINPTKVYAVDNVRAFANAGYGDSGANAGYLKTEDGVTWTRQYFEGTASENQALGFMAVASGSTLYASTYSGALLKTTNGGSTWTTVTAYPGTYAWELYPLEGDTSGQNLAVNDDSAAGLYVTSDGGATWGLRGTANPSALVWPQSGTMYSIAGGPCVSSDNGVTFNSLLTNHMTTTPFVTVDFTSETTGYALAEQGIAQTDDGGTTWTYSSLVDETIYFQYGKDLFFLDSQPNIGWMLGQPVAGHPEYLYQTTDAGATWQSLDETRLADPTDICFVDENNGWCIAAGYTDGNVRKNLWHTTDGGNSWSPVSHPGATVYAVDFVDANNGWISFNSADMAGDLVWHTADGGSTWTTQTAGNSGGQLQRIDFIDANNGYALSSFEDYFYKTTNGGTTWTQVDFSPYGETFEVTAMKFSTPMNGWVVGNQLTSTAIPSVRHPFAAHTTDGGQTWDFHDDAAAADYGSTGTNVMPQDVEAVGSRAWLVGNDGSIIATKPKPTATVTSQSTTLTAYDQSAVVTGTLTFGDVPLAGRRVELWYSSSPTGFVKGTAVATTTAEGTFSFAVKPRSHIYYVVRSPGFDTFGASELSNSVRILASPYVSNPSAPSTMYRGRRATVSGTMKPKHYLGTKVKIFRYRLVSGKWKQYGTYVSAKVTKVSYTSTSSKYSVSMSLPYAGKWRLRAYHPADSAHNAKWSSGYDYVTVK